MSNAVISLTTDLGYNDHYTGVMKGVIWGINPDINIVDLCHEINPYDIVEAAFKLECAYRYLPSQSIHIVVVDPEVGSSRRPILASGENYFFIAPDNGVLSWVYQSDNVQRVYEISASHYFLENLSSTFHGRDIFAPAAAHLSRIFDPTSFGDEIKDFKRFKLPVASMPDQTTIVGKIISIDRFGNCISNIRQEYVMKLVKQAGKDKIMTKINSKSISGLADYYAQLPPKQPLTIIGNAGYLEIALNKGHAAKEMSIRKNMDIQVSL